MHGDNNEQVIYARAPASSRVNATISAWGPVDVSTRWTPTVQLTAQNTRHNVASDHTTPDHKHWPRYPRAVRDCAITMNQFSAHETIGLLLDLGHR